MLANYVSACKTRSAMSDFNQGAWDYPNVRYFLKSIEINKPMSVTRRNIIDLPTLETIICQCDFRYLVLHVLDTILVHCMLHTLGTILVHCLI